MFADALDSVTRTLDLPSLRTVRFSGGERELRVWIDFGVAVPALLLRLREHEGNVRGVLHAWWETPRYSADDLPVELTARLGATCGERQVAGLMICTSDLRDRVDWPVLLSMLFELDVLELAGESEDLMGLDGTTLVVEILDGDRYRTYHYWSPRDAGQPDVRNAAAIIDLVGALIG